jgi:hypothetical protein
VARERLNNWTRKNSKNVKRRQKTKHYRSVLHIVTQHW